MIQNLYAHDLPGSHHSLGHLDIVAAWRRIPGGVVVNQDEAGGRVVYGRLKDLSGMDDIGVEAANGYRLSVDELIAGIEIQYKKVLLFLAANVISEIQNLFW